MPGDLTPSPAATRVAETLRERITEGRHRPGSALREASLATTLDVSRNTVREAFRLLAHEGIVEHVPNRGVRVRTLTARDLADIYRIRRVVEGLGLREVVTDARQLEEIVSAAEKAAAADDWSTVATADLRFHQVVVAALGSPRLDQLCLRMLAELRLAFIAVPDPARLHGPFLRRNRLLVDLLAAGRLGEAEAELAGYLRDAERVLVRMLA